MQQTAVTFCYENVLQTAYEKRCALNRAQQSWCKALLQICVQGICVFLPEQCSYSFKFF